MRILENLSRWYSIGVCPLIFAKAELLGDVGQEIVGGDQHGGHMLDILIDAVGQRRLAVFLLEGPLDVGLVSRQAHARISKGDFEPYFTGLSLRQKRAARSNSELPWVFSF